MAKTIFDGNPNSPYDAGIIVKDVHDYYGKSIRTTNARSIVGGYYTHFRAEYDDYSRPINVRYYRGTKAHFTKFDINSTIGLSGTYFIIRSAPDDKQWVVWFNEDDSATEPVVTNANFIEINYSSADSPQIVAFAIALTINTLNKEQFFVTRNGINIEIRTADLGEVSDSSEGTSPLLFTQTAGTQELVQKIELTYDGADPIYNGQTLKNYHYNIYSATFELKQFNLEEEWDELQTTFPSPETELFTYLKNTMPIQTVLVTYQDATKSQIVTIQKTRF
jgi:hypothetical protein